MHTNVNITMKCEFQWRFHLCNMLLVQSEKTIRITIELILKNSISVSQAEQSEGSTSVIWSFRRARFEVNRPRFRFDSNSCWEICKLTAATFEMPLFFLYFQLKAFFPLSIQLFANNIMAGGMSLLGVMQLSPGCCFNAFLIGAHSLPQRAEGKQKWFVK